MATRSGSAKKSTAKKAPAKRTAAKKTAAKKAPAKKTPAKKTPATKAPADRSTAKKVTATDVAREAVQQLHALTGRETEAVTALERTDDGWRVQVQVVELRRIPETTDVLALYDVDMDADADLQGYHRVRRYTRGEPGEE